MLISNTGMSHSRLFSLTVVLAIVFKSWPSLASEYLFLTHLSYSFILWIKSVSRPVNKSEVKGIVLKVILYDVRSSSLYLSIYDDFIVVYQVSCVRRTDVQILRTNFYIFDCYLPFFNSNYDMVFIGISKKDVQNTLRYLGGLPNP